MPKRLSLLIGILMSQLSLAHHSVSHYYDESSMIKMEVVVEEFRFLNPHPYLYVKLSDHSEESEKIIELELDNRRELSALGMNKDTFVVGEKVFVAALPSSLNSDVLYVKVIEHPRLGFGYLHNVRQLFELDEDFRAYWEALNVEYF